MHNNNNNRIDLPEEVQYILNNFNANGYEAFVVGGCVRDTLLGRTPGDWDITTAATPQQIKSIFPKTVDTGIKHGTVTVVVNNVNFEVTTYRIEGEYKDFRRPEKVEFTSSIEADLSRRDFTINAIAYNPSFGYVDPFGGISDIGRSLIVTVGDADRRFCEDALRMLRAIRFSAQLGFQIESNTLESIERSCDLIKNISSERIREELNKILLSPNPHEFMQLKATGLLHHILPELERCFDTEQNHPYHIYNVALHSLKGVSLIENDPVLRWAMLLHDVGKAVTKTTDEKGIDHFYGHSAKSVGIARIIFKRLKFDNKTMEKCLRLIEKHDRRIEATCKSLRKAVRDIGDDIFPDYLKVQEADIRSQNPEMLSERIEKLNAIKKMYFEIKESNQCLSLKDLDITGNDLIALGIKPGREIGVTLNRLLDAVLEEPELNDKDQLLQLAKRK